MPPPTLVDLPTPSLLVERRRLEENLDRAQRRAHDQGVALRPHAKTHRSADLARMQRERGAAGLTVATVDEAEYFAAAGFDDLLVAREVVDAGQLVRLAQLAAAGSNVAFCVDSIAGANLASEVLGGRARAST